MLYGRERIEAMVDVLGDDVMLALDCGPGMTPPDALRLAKRLEHLHIAWLEDTITGDYSQYVLADVYRDLTMQTSVPIHTGEQIYLRQNFRELIETQAVNIIGPDPADVGGLAELKWIAEYADLHGILMAPHGTGNGLLGLAAQVQVGATMPLNYIAFEYSGPRLVNWLSSHRLAISSYSTIGSPALYLWAARSSASLAPETIALPSPKPTALKSCPPSATKDSAARPKSSQMGMTSRRPRMFDAASPAKRTPP
jgi:hypothetical protein